MSPVLKGFLVGLSIGLLCLLMTCRHDRENVSTTLQDSLFKANAALKSNEVRLTMRIDHLHSLLQDRSVIQNQVEQIQKFTIITRIRWRDSVKVTQKPDTSAQDSICLTIPEYDFYATALVERNQLRTDSTNMAEAELLYIDLVNSKDIQLRNDLLIFEQKDMELAKAVKSAKRERRRKSFWKVTALIFAGAAGFFAAR